MSLRGGDAKFVEHARVRTSQRGVMNLIGNGVQKVIDILLRLRIARLNDLGIVCRPVVFREIMNLQKKAPASLGQQSYRSGGRVVLSQRMIVPVEHGVLRRDPFCVQRVR